MNKTLSINNPNFGFLHQTKVYIAAAFNFIGFNKYGNEYQQAILRVAIVAFIVMPIFLRYSGTLSVIFLAFVSLFSISNLYHIRKNTGLNKTRVTIAMLFDVLAASIAVNLTNDSGAIFMGAFLWFIIGYGFRYGKSMLIQTYIASLIGFTVGSLISPYWQSHMIAFYGLLFTLVTVPGYAFALLHQVNKATSKAETASKAKSQFLSHISHEIRTPLNGIVGACSLLSNTPISKDQKMLFDVIHSSSELMVQLVNEVLDIAEIESGKVTSKIERFNLQDLISSCVSLFSHQAKVKNIVLEFVIAEDTPLLLQGQLLHIKQVLINLIGNAVKFTHHGSVKIVAKVTKQAQNQARILFEIIDTGIGIDKNEIETIFESFTQANGAIKHQYGGSGLGTTISKNLITFMGGSLNVESQLDVGSRFWFEITLDTFAEHRTENSAMRNLVDAQLGVSEVLNFSDFKKPEKKSGKSYRILVADDNDVNNIIISHILMQENHQVDVVKNGELALDKLRDNEYDLMILDGNMPVMGGLEVIQIYQALNIGAPQIPIIVMSADASKDAKQTYNGSDIYAYLTKPIQVDLFIETINSAVSSGDFETAQVIDYQEAKLDNQISALLLDVDRLDHLKQLDASGQFIDNLILDFMRDTEDRMVALNTYVKAHDVVKIKTSGHTMAGSAGNVGAYALANQCEKLSNITPADHIKHVEVLAGGAQDIYTRTKLFLWDYLNQQSTIKQIPKS